MNIYKKIITVFLAAAILLNLSSVAFAFNEKTDIYRDPKGKTMVAARKGCFINAPENSLKAIRDAENAGADIIEIDVRSTADGVLILMEDETVERTCYGYGENTVVSEMTYDEIKQLRLLDGDGGYGAKETEHTVPSTEEVFRDREMRYMASSQYPAEQKALFMLDFDWAIRDKISNLVITNNMQNEVIFYIDDASPDEIASWKETLPFEPMIMTYFKGNVIFAATATVKNDSAVSDGIHLATKNPYGVNFGETVQNKAAECEIRTMAAPCIPEICGKIMQDTEEWWDYLLSCGFSVIMTDRVAELKAYLSDCEAEKTKLEEIYRKTVTDWKLPDFNSDNFHDYKLAYTNAMDDSEAILSSGSNARSDIQKARYDLENSYNAIITHYEEFEIGTAGKTVTPVTILLCILAAVLVACAEIFIYKKKKKG